MSDDIKAFDPAAFESLWDESSEEEKKQLIKDTASYPAKYAILPVLAGINSYHFSVRNLARNHLKKIIISINRKLKNPSSQPAYGQGMKASESVCFRLYTLILPDLSIQELSYYVKTLLSIKGKGSYFAFKAFYTERLSISSLSKIVRTVNQEGQLALVDEYIKASPAVRLKYARPFKQILINITDRHAVVWFFADLFDQQQDADPFLNNINDELRNPDAVIENEIASKSPELKIIGLKALSMMVNEIPANVLSSLLQNQEVKKIRLAVYSIIENSTIGLYSQLFDSVYNWLLKADKSEALSAFKALVVTGNLPLYTLFEKIRKEYPKLMTNIKNEISSLSKISFFVIQDIAINKEKYVKSNFDINLACVLGMIQKRPERVIRILQKYESDSQDKLRMDVTSFIEKTRNLLKKEKKDIESEFDPIKSHVKESAKSDKGIISKIFSSGIEKSIQLLKENRETTTIHLDNEVIRKIDFSSTNYLASPVYFTHSVIHNCDFSHASFIQPFFKKAIFYNINMDHVDFDSANFDDAVFINVSAKEGVFSKCSFQRVKFFNCNFNNAEIKDCSFFDSTISKTSFNLTTISSTSFSFSKISAVSFATALIDLIDFSYVQARFCRLPSKSKSAMKTDKISYNSRKFQMAYDQMPQMDAVIVKDIDILTFSEFIHYGEAKFIKQNRLSQLMAFDIFKAKQSDLFQLIPMLLHSNFDFPGFSSIDPMTPAGIQDYQPDREAFRVLEKYIKQVPESLITPESDMIQGVFTIGSIGSVAQTSDSDIDYWICVNEDQFSLEDNYLLDQKLAKLEKMAIEKFETQVTFFKVDVTKARNNDFGDSSSESSGSAQSRILKEEFYRTMIHVAGKIPLWAVLPTSISLQYYNTILKNTGSMPNLSRYIDLGDIHAISNSEYYGASIWQMFKWLKSPFKSVIKMALLEKYIYEYGKKALLCNSYKDEWMNSGAQLKLAHNDSYYILLKDLLEYYRKTNDQESVFLLLTCFFLKIEITRDAQIENTVFGLRRIFLDKCVSKWGLDKQKIFDVGNYKSWPYSQIVNLSTTIERYMVKKYKTVNKAFDRLFHGKSQISPEDRTVLGRKVFVEFSNQSGKVQKILLISRSERHFQGLHLRYLNPTKTVGYWELINRDSRSNRHQEEVLNKAKTIEEIGAWLINNGLYTPETVINMIPNPTYVTFDDIRKLYAAMYEFFEPLLHQTAGFDQLLEKAQVTDLFISINFYAPRQQSEITEYTAVFLNTWGEMFCKSIYKKEGFSNLETTKMDIIQKIGIPRLPKNTAFYFSKGLAR